MAFAITQSCCADASCVAVCPVNCIHPTPDEPDFGLTEMLYVDPRACIDCGACADACPVDAVRPVESLLGADAVYADLNRDHYAERVDPEWDPPRFPAALDARARDLRVAIVGTGPAASYTAAALLTTSAEVTMIDRLPEPGGLVRFGVAPDHTRTRAIAERFATLHRNPRLHLRLGVEVGADVSHDELLAQHDAVVYAVGASADRRLGVPGEDLPGSLPARAFVGWYNGQPETPSDLVDLVDLPSRRVVVIGNGNVALDMARLLLGDTAALAGTGIAGHALHELRRSTVTEVVLVARRGPADAAYSLAELRPLLARTDLDVVVDAPPEHHAEIEDAAPGSPAAALRGLAPHWTADVAAPAATGALPARRRLVLRFGCVVDALEGVDRVEAVRLLPTGGVTAPAERLETHLVLRSIGYRSEPVPGLPFDETTHTVPHRAGRVVDPATGRPVPATYVVGWVKRGPTGGIGTNRTDAADTVASLVADANAGVITSGRGSTRALERLLRRRRPEPAGRRR